MRRFRARLTLAPRYDSEPVPGLPEGAMVLTNTDRKSLYCPRKWWYSQGLGLQTTPSGAMRFGSSFDRVMGGILEWFREHDSVPTMPDIWESVLEEECADICANEQLYKDGPEHEIKRLVQAVKGWLVTHGEHFQENYRVLQVQPMLACPVISPRTGKTYRSKVPVVVTDEGWRLATARDTWDDVTTVTLPWFQLCKLDAVVLNKHDGMIWAWETKTSSNPDSFSRSLDLDTQLPGYIRALWYATRVLGLYDGKTVGGYVWDVTSSRTHKWPKLLTSGRYSTAASQGVASWTWMEVRDELLKKFRLATVDDAREQLSHLESEATIQKGLSDRYAEQVRGLGRAKPKPHLRKVAGDLRTQRDEATRRWKELRDEMMPLQNLVEVDEMIGASRLTVDPSLYVRRWGECSYNLLSQYELELFLDAQKIAENLRKCVGTWDAAPSGTSDRWVPNELDKQVSLDFPRVPLCRSPGGFCPYTGPCIQDGESVRNNYEQRKVVRWLNTTSAQAHVWEGDDQ